MTADLFSSVILQTGEGVLSSDLLNSQRFLGARITDQLMESQIGDLSLTGLDPFASGARGTDAPSHLAYCLHGGSAYLRQGSSPTKLGIAPGVLFQKVANQNGTNSTFLGYSFAGTEEVSIANGDATLPRIDLVQMKLEYEDADSQSRHFKDATTGALSTIALNKKQRVKCTLSVKTGTPAATPQYPDPDTGYVALAGVVVMQTYSVSTPTPLRFDYELGSGTACVHDLRMPLRHDVRNILLESASVLTNWVKFGHGIQSNNVSNNAHMIVPCGTMERLIGVDIWKDPTNAFSFSYIGTGSPAGGILTASEATGFHVPVSAAPRVVIPYYTLEANYFGNGYAVASILPSAVNKIGPPLWGHGRCAAPVSAAASEVFGLFWGMGTTVSGSIVTAARCFVAR